MAHIYVATGLIFLAVIGFVRVVYGNSKNHQAAEAALFAGLGVYLGGVLAQWGTVSIPVDLFGMAGLSLTLAGLYANRFQGTPQIWLLAAAVAGVFFLLASVLVVFPASQEEPVRTLLKLHIGFIVTAIGFLLCLGFLAGVYLLKERALRLDPAGLAHRLPSLDSLDRFQLRLLQAGFVLLTVGISLGLLMLLTAADDLLQADLLAATTLIIWIIMGFALYLRLWRGWRGHRLAVFSCMLVGGLTLAVLVTFVSQTGMHGAR